MEAYIEAIDFIIWEVIQNGVARAPNQQERENAQVTEGVAARLEEV